VLENPSVIPDEDGPFEPTAPVDLADETDGTGDFTDLSPEGWHALGLLGVLLVAEGVALPWVIRASLPVAYFLVAFGLSCGLVLAGSMAYTPIAAAFAVATGASVGLATYFGWVAPTHRFPVGWAASDTGLWTTVGFLALGALFVVWGSLRSVRAAA